MSPCYISVAYRSFLERLLSARILPARACDATSEFATCQTYDRNERVFRVGFLIDLSLLVCFRASVGAV